MCNNSAKELVMKKFFACISIALMIEISLAGAAKPGDKFLDGVRKHCGNACVAIDRFNEYPNKNGAILNLIGTLMHIPYVSTLDSKDVRSVRLAGVLAAMPTTLKTIVKFLEKPQNKRFYNVLLWDVPKFVSYALSDLYDGINVINPEHMIVERQQKGADLSTLKKDQALYLSFEILLRFLAVIVACKADNAQGRSNADLTMIANLISEIADITELWRLLTRYRTYKTTPGLDISFNVEVRHIGSLGNVDGEIDFFAVPLEESNVENIASDRAVDAPLKEVVEPAKAVA